MTVYDQNFPVNVRFVFALKAPLLLVLFVVTGSLHTATSNVLFKFTEHSDAVLENGNMYMKQHLIPAI